MMRCRLKMRFESIKMTQLIMGVLISSCFLSGCSGSVKEQAVEKNIENTEAVETVQAEEPEDDGKGMLSVNESKDGILIDDILECRHYIGKTCEEVGIPGSVIRKESYGLPQTYADGKIFGIKDYGIIYFSKDSEGNIGPAESMWIHVKGIGFEECREELRKLFGEPVSEGEEPYVEVNGGAVMWADFRDGGFEIRLSNASEREYCEISISLKGDEEKEEETAIIDNIKVFKQNSIRIRGSVGTIYIDPFQMSEAPNDADFILITHDHHDHYSPEDIDKVVGEDTTLVISEGMKDEISEISGKMREVVTVKPGSSYELEGLGFDTVASYNTLKPFHPKKAGWVGYILHLDGKLIYIAGDTDVTEEAKAVKCDIALVPIGGTYTMDAKQAAELINTIQPEIAIPTHYGSIVGSPGDGEVFARNVKEPVQVELKITF